MNILHVTPAFYPATYWGGPIFSTYGLCNALAEIPGTNLRVLTTDTAGPSKNDSVQVTGFPMIYGGAYEVYFCRRKYAVSVSPDMLFRLWPMIRWADVVHLTGVYSSPTIPTLLLCRILGKPVVWSPRGSLQRWEQATRQLLKKIWEQTCNALIASSKCVLHVTSEQEARDSEARVPNGRAIMIPNGVDLPKLGHRAWRPSGKLRLLYLGRLHPIKGIENLLQAMRRIGDATVSLSIYGAGEKHYVNHLHSLVTSLGLKGSVAFMGYADGVEKANAFMNADVCVVPSYTENFCMVVAEALSHGVPVVAGKGTPWHDLDAHDCGLCVENSPESLAAAITQVKSAPLQAWGHNGRAWMNREFEWTSIAARMIALYRCATDATKFPLRRSA